MPSCSATPTSLARLTTGDVVKFVKNGKTRHRRVLVANGVGDYRTYTLSVASKRADGRSLKRAFVTMTAFELAEAGYTKV